ncbi:MAG: hypothetical protein NC120_10295 [Ruminococcus sp.]|nr:hypothetical protein [Ruminococcus sp.]
MGVYITGKIIYEDDTTVEYSYGIDDSMQGRLVIGKNPFTIQKVEGVDKFAPKSTAFQLTARIKKYYDERGVYPNNISKQS